MFQFNIIFNRRSRFIFIYITIIKVIHNKYRWILQKLQEIFLINIANWLLITFQQGTRFLSFFLALDWTSIFLNLNRFFLNKTNI